MYSSYACGIAEINQVRVRKIPANRNIKVASMVRNGHFVLFKTPSGALYGTHVHHACVVGYGCSRDIKMLHQIGAISQGARDEYLAKDAEVRAQRGKYYAARRMEECAEEAGIKLTKYQLKKIKEVRLND